MAFRCYAQYGEIQGYTMLKVLLYTNNMNWEGKYSSCKACVRQRYESLSYSHYSVNMR